MSGRVALAIIGTAVWILGACGLQQTSSTTQLDEPKPTSTAKALQPDASPTTGGGLFVNSPLVAASRTWLSACIQSENAADTQVFLDAVQALAAELRQRPKEVQGWTDGAQAVLGCPQPTALDGKRHSSGDGTTGVRVTSASPHRLFVYLVSSEELRVAFGNSRFGVATEEILCPPEGGTCAAATTGIYLVELDQDTLYDAIIEALGLIALRLPQDLEVP